MTKQGKKLVIFSDSIAKRIDMVEFGKACHYKHPIKRSFGGATASDLKYYVQPTILDKNPDIAIIHGGSNNLLKKAYQTDMDIVNEVMEIVMHCRNGGINEIYVSALTCIPAHQARVNSINQLFLEYSYTYDYCFIDNSHITSKDLWRDNLHLSKEGIIKLANNFLYFVNNDLIRTTSTD